MARRPVVGPVLAKDEFFLSVGEIECGYPSDYPFGVDAEFLWPIKWEDYTNTLSKHSMYNTTPTPSPRSKQHGAVPEVVRISNQNASRVSVRLI